MKMRPTEYKALEKLITEIHTPGRRRQYRQAGLSATRYYMDHLWTIPATKRQQWFDDFAIYTYLDDTHILTAVRRIVRRLDSQ